MIEISFTLNGEPVVVKAEPSERLLDTLRYRLGLSGTKEGCGEGECGACTVILDGETAYACLTLAIDCQGRQVRTIEGLAAGEQLHPVQLAFIEKDGYQCGFCTPGQVVSAVALLEHNPHPTAEDVRREMSGNVCRCGAYPNIIEAVLLVAEKER